MGHSPHSQRLCNSHHQPPVAHRSFEAPVNLSCQWPLMSAACAFRRWLKLSSAYRPRSLDDVGLGAIAKASEMIGVFIWAANMPRRDPFPKDFNEFHARIKITCIPPPHLCNFRFTNVSLLGQKDCCLTEVCKPLILN